MRRRLTVGFMGLSARYGTCWRADLEGRMKLRLATVALLMFGPITATADPVTILPNGDLVVDLAVKTSATFTCGGSVPCTGSGTNAITIGSGSNVAKIGFFGVN